MRPKEQMVVLSKSRTSQIATNTPQYRTDSQYTDNFLIKPMAILLVQCGSMLRIPKILSAAIEMWPLNNI